MGTHLAQERKKIKREAKAFYSRDFSRWRRICVSLGEKVRPELIKIRATAGFATEYTFTENRGTRRAIMLDKRK